MPSDSPAGTAMTSRQRVLAALNHREPDRVPLDVGGTTATGINLRAYDALKEHLHLPGPTVIASRRSSLAALPESLLRRLGSDVRAVHPPAPDAAPGLPEADGSFVDAWGCRFVRPPEGHYYVREPVMAGPLTAHDLAAYPWPDPTDPGYTRGLAAQAEALHVDTDCAVVLSLPVGFIHQCQFLRGFQDWLMDLAADPPLAEALLDHVLDIWQEIALRLVRAAGPFADVVFYADDIAHQSAMLMSLAAYRRLIKPRQARLLRALHSATAARIVYHSCGAVYPAIGDLIEIGVDALNPVQVSATGMEPARLKREFGRHICFWGGVDTHHVLPHGTPDEVRAEVRRRAAELAQGGGYVIASVHNIQAEVPPGNILAMCDQSLRERPVND